MNKKEPKTNFFQVNIFILKVGSLTWKLTSNISEEELNKAFKQYNENHEEHKEESFQDFLRSLGFFCQFKGIDEPYKV